MTVFRPSANLAAKLILLVTAGVAVAGLGWWWGFPRTNYVRNIRWTVNQPVPFSHEHHVAGLGSIAACAIRQSRSRPTRACRRPTPA